MTGLNSDHSTGVLHLRFSAICAGVFLLCAPYPAWYIAAYLEFHEAFASGADTILVQSSTDDLLPFPLMLSVLMAASCCVMRFPLLGSFRTQSTIREIFHEVNTHFSLSKKALWAIALVFITLLLSEAYYILLRTLFDAALALGGAERGAAPGSPATDGVLGQAVFFLLAACMGLPSSVWLLRRDIRRQAGRRAFLESAPAPPESVSPTGEEPGYRELRQDAGVEAVTGEEQGETGSDALRPAGVFRIRFTAMFAGMFFAGALILSWTAAAYLENLGNYEVLESCGFGCVEITIRSAADLMSFLYAVLMPFAVAGLVVAACAAMRFPALAFLRTQGALKEILYVGRGLSPSEKVLWSAAAVLIMALLSAAYYTSLQVLLELASAFGAAAPAPLATESVFSRAGLILLAACMGLATLAWLLRIEIRRQAPGNEAAA